MTVSTVINHEQYTGNGVTTAFPFRFRILKSSHMVVTVSDTDGNLTTLINGSDYTVKGVGLVEGGTVNLSSPLMDGWKISLDRDLPATQETDLRNQGKFFAETHEDVFDYLTMLVQKCLGLFGLALRRPSWLAKYYDAEGNRISNMGDPVYPQDGVTKSWVESLYIDESASATVLKNQLASTLPGQGDAMLAVKQPLAASVARTQHDKNMDFVTVKDFGAKGDGATDDTVAFQRASTIGGVIAVPSGSYRIDGAVTGYGVHFIFLGSSWNGAGSIQGNITYFSNSGLKVGRDYHWRTQSGVNSSLVIGEHLALQQDDPGSLATLRVYPEGGVASPTQIAIEPYFVNDVNELHSVGNGEDITSILCGKSTQPDGSEERGGWVFKEYADGQRYRHHRIASFATITGTPRDIHVVMGAKRLAMFDWTNGRTLFDNSNVSGVASTGNTVIDVKNANNTKVMRIFANAGNGEKGISHLTSGAQDMRLVFDTNALKLQGLLSPTADNQGSVGTASLRFNAFYATNGTIQTSDEREKTLFDLNDDEIAAAKDVMKSVVKYRWNADVEKYGEAASFKFGLTVQSIIRIMERHGLNWKNYAMITYDDEADRYGMNYSEVMSFCMAGLVHSL